ncbi:hypothetical protein RIF29_41113 [Crotalaria pallida]|uniref:WRKY domain-containing protein n=1 Tax=Crotalaria pallida TaxID=3830 RepID=A0AAN9E5T3_CROPI
MKTQTSSLVSLMDTKKREWLQQQLHNSSASSSSSTAGSSFPRQIPITTTTITNNNSLVLPSQLEEAAPTNPTFNNNMSHSTSLNNHSPLADDHWIADFDFNEDTTGASGSSKVHGPSKVTTTQLESINSSTHASVNNKMKEPLRSNVEQENSVSPVEATDGKARKQKGPIHTFITETPMDDNLDDGCGVRKKVMRSSANNSNVITTYLGKHNHDPPKGSRPISYRFMHDAGAGASAGAGGRSSGRAGGLLSLPHMENPVVDYQFQNASVQQQQPSLFIDNNNDSTLPIRDYVMNSMMQFNGGGFANSSTHDNIPNPPLQEHDENNGGGGAFASSSAYVTSHTNPPPPVSNYVMNSPPPPQPSFNGVVVQEYGENHGGGFAPLPDFSNPPMIFIPNPPLLNVNYANSEDQHGGDLPPLPAEISNPPLNVNYTNSEPMFGGGVAHQGHEEDQHGGGLPPLPDAISYPPLNGNCMSSEDWFGGFAQEHGGGFEPSSITLIDNEDIMRNTGLLEDIVMSTKLTRRENN